MASVLSSFKVGNAAPAAQTGTYKFGYNSTTNVFANQSPSLLSKLASYADYLSLPSLKGASYTDIAFTILAIVATVLVLEQVNYRHKKKGLPGPKWTIPIIGKFADSVNPTLQKYKAGWDSGPLSAVSVFNIFIVVASSTEHSRKILNSPNYAEPCLTASARKVLLHDNW